MALFSTLDKKEVRAGEKFIRSPFYNHREDVQQLEPIAEKKWLLERILYYCE